MKTAFFRIPAIAIALALGAACVTASAQDAKQALAAQLAQIQAKTGGPALADQLAGTAIQPRFIEWSQRLHETVAPERQDEVGDKLDVELKKFSDSTHQAIDGAINQAAQTALVPILMDKLSEDDLRAIVTFLQSEANAKFQALGADASGAWAQAVVDATRAQVESSAKAFDEAAARILGEAPAAAKATPKAPAKKK